MKVGPSPTRTTAPTTRSRGWRKPDAHRCSPEGVKSELLEENDERAPVGDDHGGRPGDGSAAHAPVGSEGSPTDVDGRSEEGDGEIRHGPTRHGQHDAAASAASVDQHGHAENRERGRPSNELSPEEPHDDRREDGHEQTCRPGESDQPRCPRLVDITSLPEQSPRETGERSAERSRTRVPPWGRSQESRNDWPRRRYRLGVWRRGRRQGRRRATARSG